MHFRTGTLVLGAAMGTAIGFGAAPALAQDAAVCAGLDAGAWFGGAEANADASTAAGPLDLTGLTIPPNGNVITNFSVSAPGPYRMEALPSFGGDSVIEIYAADGTLVVSDDDGGGNFASRAEFDLEPGSYCMLTRGFGGGALVSDVRVARAELDALTGGLDGGTGFFAGVTTCTASTPATDLGQGSIDAILSQGVTQTNTIAGTPYYRFTLAQPQAITIRAENEFADPYIYIFDNNGGLIAENDDYNSLNARIDFTQPLAAGTYCIAMRSLSDPSQPVTVSVRGYDPTQAMFEMYATGEASPPVGSGYPITDLGMLQSRLVMDQAVGADAVWYSFTVPEGGLALIDAIEITNSDPVISLFDGVGREIAFNDDANGTLDSQLTVRVSPGQYMLGVTQYSSSYDGVIRVSLERYVPAQ